MKILVTGGAGYIGSTLTRQLLKKGNIVTVFDSLRFGGESVIDLLSEKNFKFINGDIRRKKEVISALKSIECVIHLAALVGEPACKINPKETEEINHQGAKIVCDLAKHAGVKRFIYVSTCSNYGISDPKHPATEESALYPTSLYAETKIAAEKYVINQADDEFYTCGLRLATVYGISPRMRFDLLVNEIVRDAYLNKKVVLYQPLAFRPFIHVSDVSRAIILCTQTPGNKITGQIFNVGNSNYQKKEIMKYIKKYIPDCRGEVVDKATDRRNYSVNFGKIKRELGFQAKINLNSGIEELLIALKLGIFKDPTDYRYANVGWSNL